MRSMDFGRVLLEAVTAAENGIEPKPERASAIVAGGNAVRLTDLGYDSLGWMEFCISIELQTGTELTPDLLDQFGTLADVATWIAQRSPS